MAHLSTQCAEHPLSCCCEIERPLICAGVGHKPALDFSFQQHDFGPCFVKQAGMQPAQKILRLKNNDDSDLSFDIEYAALLCILAALQRLSHFSWQLCLPYEILQSCLVVCNIHNRHQ